MKRLLLLQIIVLALACNAQKAGSDVGNIVVIKNYMKSQKEADLTKDETRELEEILLRIIVDNNNAETKESTKYLKPLSNYNRQYLPFYRKGEKQVLVNCFCESIRRFPNWKKEVVTVFDGGSCYFMVFINLTTKAYEDLVINGVG